jgi:hypothetical protein
MSQLLPFLALQSDIAYRHLDLSSRRLQGHHSGHRDYSSRSLTMASSRPWSVCDLYVQCLGCVLLQEERCRGRGVEVHNARIRLPASNF